LPALGLGEVEMAGLIERVRALPYLQAEPRGW
jgi:hypothetical protein